MYVKKMYDRSQPPTLFCEGFAPLSNLGVHNFFGEVENTLFLF